MAFGLAVYASQGVCTEGAAHSHGPTQDSLPVAGQALLDGILTRKVPMKGFKVVNYISFPFPKLSWRNRCNRLQEANRETRRGVDHLSHFGGPRRPPQGGPTHVDEAGVGGGGLIAHAARRFVQR